MTSENQVIKNNQCSIIIRAYNEEQHIYRLLTGIMEQNLGEIEIILVDSGSTDNTVEIAKKFPVQIVKILPEDFSFGRALNLGISKAHHEYIVMASAHVYPVYPDWLERLLAPFENEKIGLAYGKQRGTPATKFSENQVFAKWYPDESQTFQSHPFCNNANSAIRRSLWEKHPYDETISGLEDLEWANWLLLSQRYLLSYVAEAEVIHVHNETPKIVFNRYQREARAFKHIFPQENFNFGDLLRLFVVNAFNDLWCARQQKQLKDNWQNILWFRWMQFSGTYKGYRLSGPLTWQLRQTFYYPRKNIDNKPQNINRTVDPIKYHK